MCGPQPSGDAMRRARELGLNLAAKCDRRLITAIASRHNVFVSFQWDYRFRLEQTPQFQPFERELQRMAEREASKSHLNTYDSRYWNAVESNLLAPLKAAFWSGCEQRLRIGEMFEGRNPVATRAPAEPKESSSTDDEDARQALVALSKWV